MESKMIMINRLIRFYKEYGPRACDTMSALWNEIVKTRQANFISAMEAGNVSDVERQLCYLSKEYLSYGMESNCGIYWDEEDGRFRLEMLAQHVGVLPFFNPEQPSWKECWKLKDRASVIENLKQTIGMSPELIGFLDFGNRTPHRFLHYLALWHDVRMWFNCPPKNILEIGAGLGILGIIASRNGTKRFTVIDLPSVAVMSAFALSKECGPEKVWMLGEPDNTSAFARFFPSTNCEALDGDADLIFNSDSIPEMTSAIQDKYIDLISRSLSSNGIFLSMNQETDNAGQGRVYDAVKRSGKLRLVRRNPFHLRPGYVEEFYVRN